MRTASLMMLLVSALPAVAERNEKQSAVQKQDAPHLVMAVQLGDADRPGARSRVPVRGTRDEGRRSLQKLGPAPRVHLTAEQVAEVAGGIQARASGNVLIVDCHGNYDHDTIQGAIDAASDGDVIIVLPNTCNEDGHYFENINFFGKGITVQSLLPEDPDIVAATVLDGSGDDLSAVRFVTGEGPDSILDGLTITGGIGTVADLRDDGWDAPIAMGGGILCHNSSPTIRHCRIVNNQATEGGGIAIRDGHPTITQCHISNNLVQVAPFPGFFWLPEGGGVALSRGSALLDQCHIEDNLIDVFLNRIPRWGNGAGISVITGDVDSPQLLMRLHNCVVGGNEINGSGSGPGLSSYGGGLMAFGYSPNPANIELDIRNSIFEDNRAPEGAGLYLGSDTTAAIQGTTIAGNYWEQTGGNGLGGQSSSATIVSSLIYGNVPFDVTADYDVDYVFEYSNIGVTEDVEVEGPGNINAAPLFVDPDNGDYHLTADSPCVDAGDPEFVPEKGETDIDGEPRVVGERVDMGADEFGPPDLCADGDGRVTVCHLPPGNPENAHTITVSVRALPAHLAHGDHCGPCE